MDKWDYCDEPMRLYYDNKCIISIAHQPVQHDRTKHIENDKYWFTSLRGGVVNNVFFLFLIIIVIINSNVYIRLISSIASQTH